MGHPRHHLHQQGGGRDAHAGRRPGRPAGREDVGLDLPLGLPAHPAHQRRPAGLPLGLHGLRRHRLAPPHRDDHGRARLRPEAAAVAGGAGRHQPGQVRAGRLRDVPRGRPQRARPVPQAHRRRLRAVPAAAAGGQRPRLRRPAHGDGQPAAGLRRRAGVVPGALPPHPGRRVPGHEPRPERDRQAAGRGARQRLRGRRLRPVGLPLARRGHPQHLGVRAGLPQRDDDHAGAELPLDPDDPRRRQRGHRQQRRPPAQGALHRRRHRRARSRGTGPRTSATRRPGSPSEILRLHASAGPRRGATSPSSTAPTRRACRSRRP